jgi:hypothetical protein
MVTIKPCPLTLISPGNQADKKFYLNLVDQMGQSLAIGMAPNGITILTPSKVEIWNHPPFGIATGCTSKEVTYEILVDDQPLSSHPKLSRYLVYSELTQQFTLIRPTIYQTGEFKIKLRVTQASNTTNLAEIDLNLII